jgi:hypothetical protein
MSSQAGTDLLLDRLEEVLPSLKDNEGLALRLIQIVESKSYQELSVSHVGCPLLFGIHSNLN